jgi:tetratricopeptide (TPR) repeat protein
MDMLQQGEHNAARAISESLIEDRSTEPLHRYKAYYCLALAAKHRAEYQKALAYLDRAYEIDSSPQYEAPCFYESGGVYILQGRFTEARQAIGTAIRLNADKSDVVASRSRRKYQCALAFVRGLQGEPERGLKVLSQVEFPSNERFSIAIKESYTGSLLGLAGDPWTALQHHEKAAATIDDLGVISAGAMVYNLLADANLDCGKVSEARRCMQVGHRLALKTGDVFETARSKLVFSSLCEEENDSDRARAYRKEAARVLHRIGSEWVFDRHLAKIEAR